MLAGIVYGYTQMQQLFISSCKVIEILVLVLCILENPFLEALILDQCLQAVHGAYSGDLYQQCQYWTVIKLHTVCMYA